MLRKASVLLAPALVLSLVIPAMAAGKKEAFTDPAKAGPDFGVQGEYVGTLKNDEGEMKVGAQVIALGEGEFRLVGYGGGLPGAGWEGDDKIEVQGEMVDGVPRFDVPSEDLSLVIKDGVLTVEESDGRTIGTLKKAARKSPTLGAKPPAGAVVLFDGSTPDHFEGGRMTDDGLLMQGATSKQKFGSFELHLEFCTPFMPEARGQGRGNSGFYAQGRYEVQILDSFGLEGLDNECGGAYSIAPPKVNMCFPPLSWQTYDVEFTAAEYKDGEKVKNARMTVLHNGVEIHKEREYPNATPSAPLQDGPEPGPVFLQDHGNPVRFRNIWVVEKK